MASLLGLTQQVFSALNSGSQSSQQLGCNVNATEPHDSGANPLTGVPASLDISSILTFLFSFSAMRDWIKLVAIGALLESLRRVVFHLYTKLYNSFFITALFEDDDYSYDWMMVWLAEQPSWTQARDVQISTRSFGLNTDTVLIDGEEDDPMVALRKTRKLVYLPSLSSTFSFWYKRRWVRVTRAVRDSANECGFMRVESITVRILSWDHRILNEMLLEAKKAYQKVEQSNIFIHVADSTNNDWRRIACRTKRTLNSIVLDPGIKDQLMNDARDFLASKSWYMARGIPFRRGYLLYGAPGTGKTSIIHSLAGELRLGIYVISLSRAGLDDNSLNELISELPERCIALMEDIDAAFGQTLNRDSDDEDDDAPKRKNGNRSASPKSTSRVSLSGLLNALDGVAAQEGRILFATTNKYASLDPALCRPGRMDVHIEFKLASKYQAEELFRGFYLPDSEAGDEPTEEAEESGYCTSDDEKAELKEGVTVVDEAKASAKGATHPLSARGAPNLSRRQASAFARKFAAQLPEREFSMAALQGYLMCYKTRPYEAVADAAKWVAKERADVAARKASADKEKEAAAEVKEGTVEAK